MQALLVWMPHRCFCPLALAMPALWPHTGHQRRVLHFTAVSSDSATQTCFPREEVSVSKS